MIVSYSKTTVGASGRKPSYLGSFPIRSGCDCRSYLMRKATTVVLVVGQGIEVNKEVMVQMVMVADVEDIQRRPQLTHQPSRYSVADAGLISCPRYLFR
jgi:hypothetical protein